MLFHFPSVRFATIVWKTLVKLHRYDDEDDDQRRQFWRRQSLFKVFIIPQNCSLLSTVSLFWLPTFAQSWSTISSDARVSSIYIETHTPGYTTKSVCTYLLPILVYVLNFNYSSHVMPETKFGECLMQHEPQLCVLDYAEYYTWTAHSPPIIRR